MKTARSHARPSRRGRMPFRGRSFGIRLPRLRPASGRPPRVVAWLLGLAALAGCDTTPPLAPAARVVAPYPLVLAVAPLANESGTTISPSLRAEVSDDLVAAINRVDGWNAVPLDRTLTAMAQLDMAEVLSEADARELVRVIGVDAILVGTITEWGPYDPPRFGSNLLLIADQARLSTTVDARELYGRTGDAATATGGAGEVRTVTDVVVDLDATDHRTRQSLRDYARSHVDVTGGFDPPDRYFMMVYSRYLEFAAHEVIRDLVEREHARVLSGG